MTSSTDNDELKVNAKVVAKDDLPGVPAGTPGRVTLKNGFRWTRYRVEFDNGVGIGSLDRAQLVPRKEYEAQQKAAG
ncbi:MAG TPA: hypothetical protein PKE05_05010 [Microthrixaceae bacterium]|nr:hypothetical protein [Microthrixaceae bacterium]RTL05398.1 MAG: hypothetical protein EKK62_14710 [Acidimicrobiia bacterium]HMR94874.1 hypothetical protein [Microthrixaceae bacterium]